MSKHYETSDHRSGDTDFSGVQEGNKRWWTENTMSYDWGERVPLERYSIEWYDEIDRRFVLDSALYAHENSIFDKIIPFDQLSGKRVLEVGCGMGLHTELLVRSGAAVTSVDISETSVEATRKRLGLKKLEAIIIQQDAESLPFSNNSFDFVWSWGVIHHSSRTAKIVREIGRVLTPQGSCRVMVYNRDGASAWRAIAKYRWLRLGALRGVSVDTALNRGTDGFHARHYTLDQFEDLFRAYFVNVSSEICGQIPDALPLPRIVRRLAQRFVTQGWMKRAQSRRGSFIFLSADTVMQ